MQTLTRLSFGLTTRFGLQERTDTRYTPCHFGRTTNKCHAPMGYAGFDFSKDAKLQKEDYIKHVF